MTDAHELAQRLRMDPLRRHWVEAAADLIDAQVAEIKTWQNQNLLEQCNRQVDKIQELIDACYQSP